MLRTSPVRIIIVAAIASGAAGGIRMMMIMMIALLLGMMPNEPPSRRGREGGCHVAAVGSGSGISGSTIIAIAIVASTTASL